MRKLPPLHSLRAFEAAARHLHFTHAAEELHLTPTAISHQVRQLEEILGVELFRRYPRPVRLSPAGEKLFPVLRDSLDRIAAAIGQLSDDQNRPLRLSVTMAFASRWLMPRLLQLREQTGVLIEIEADDHVADLHASGIDMAIRYAERAGMDAEWHRLFPDRIIPVCAPGLLLDRAQLTPDQVLALPLLHYRWRSGAANAPNWERWQAQAQADRGRPHITQTFSEEVHALDAVVAGQGAVLASELLVSDQLNAGTLVPLSDISLPGPTYWAVFLTSHPAKERLQILLEWFRSQRSPSCTSKAAPPPLA
ncbi:LysR family transcriptional regulator [Rhizobium sp. Root73]|uniref:LysR substrate-binding domain-containing protein n=1 Tax=unclassified Rhizobium TaxID=2613769 RepID=UPI000727819F|nr:MULTISPECIES: LysR substrate-binding domain-containing protein [unclassified Rhizobium]KQY13064.1 LysR family transcriptional regulator [Rhizobium sp. Root1334]KRC12525.1 LysR family transcriptional regulator [Rhizobium sp. Root73]